MITLSMLNSHERGFEWCAVTVVLLLVASSPAGAQITVVPDTSRVIKVTGRGEIRAVPDMATVDLGVVAFDSDARKAKATVDGAVSRIVALTRGLGVGTEAINTAALNVEPRYDREQTTKLLGFEVTRSVNVVLRDLTKLDALLDGAVQAGANKNFDISVNTSQEERLKKEALGKAFDDARAQATLSAERLGVRVGVVRSINLTSGAGGVINASMVASQSYTEPAAKFLPGLIQIYATVTVDFTLQDP